MDVMPLVHQMLHPQINAIRSQLLSNEEKETLRRVVEIMVIFDIKLLDKDDTDEKLKDIPIWEPNIAKLVIFGDKNSSSQMQAKIKESTQQLIRTNYEPIKQFLLAQQGKEQNTRTSDPFESR